MKTEKYTILFIVCFLSSIAIGVYSAGLETKSSPLKDKTNQITSPIFCQINQTISNRLLFSVCLSNMTDSTVFIYEPLLLRAKKPEFAPFRIYRGTEQISYKGVFIKRNPPTADEYHQMRPHETSRGHIDLTSFFEISKGGQYSVKYYAIFPELGGTNLVLIESDSVSVTLP